MAKSENLSVLTTVPSEVEAALILSALEDEGIEASPSGELTAQFRAEAPGVVRILVRTEDAERAQEILTELREATQEIDWSQVDVGEPEET